MVKLLNLGMQNAVAFEMRGKITKEDMELILNDARTKIEKYGEIVILKQIESFDGIELEALYEEFQYLHEMGISNIKKVAVVSDKKWIEKIVALENEIFSNIEIEYFDFGDIVNAMFFLNQK